MNASPDLQIALLGYGAASRVFHVPLLHGVPGVRLRGVVSSRPAAVQADWPALAVYPDAAAALADPQVDAVVIATPNDSHYPLALAALEAGKHVVVDKPCTVTLAQTEHLLAEAERRKRVLTVFQNRRLDSDFLALQQVLAAGQLGRVVQVDAHFDRYRPVVPQRWRDQDQPGAGLWLDLGAHLVDQALLLWGLPDAIQLDLACVRDGARVNDWFHALLRYERAHPGLRVLLHASTLVAQPGPRWAVHGTRGSFVKWGLDSQEEALKAGRRPQADALGDWGADPQPGELLTWIDVPGLAQPVEVRRQASAPAGNYLAYYANLRDHLWGRAALMAPPQQVRQVMRVLEAGQHSAAQGRWMPLGGGA